jgi:hypothetical protein
MIAGVAAGLTVVLMIMLIVQVYSLTAATREQQQENTKTSERIEECTTPGRPCFEDSARRTAEAVGSLNAWTEAAVTCADQTGTQPRAEIRACIIRTLREK